MRSLARLSLVLTEISSIALLVLVLLYLLSGYAMMKPSIVETLCFKLVNRDNALYIHGSSALRLLFNVFLVIHCSFGLVTILYRRVRNRRLRAVLTISSVAAVMYFVVPLILADVVSL